MASYSETLERIYNLHGGAIDLRLDRVAGALKLFDHPERKFPSLHIAGTNGTGSTSARLQRIPTTPPPANLTPAEREILELVQLGHSNEAIAALRARSMATVAKQVSVIMRKAGVEGRSALASIDVT